MTPARVPNAALAPAAPVRAARLAARLAVLLAAPRVARAQAVPPPPPDPPSDLVCAPLARVPDAEPPACVQVTRNELVAGGAATTLWAPRSPGARGGARRAVRWENLTPALLRVEAATDTTLTVRGTAAGDALVRVVPQAAGGRPDAAAGVARLRVWEAAPPPAPDTGLTWRAAAAVVPPRAGDPRGARRLAVRLVLVNRGAAVRRVRLGGSAAGCAVGVALTSGASLWGEEAVRVEWRLPSPPIPALGARCTPGGRVVALAPGAASDTLRTEFRVPVTGEGPRGWPMTEAGVEARFTLDGRPVRAGLGQRDLSGDAAAVLRFAGRVWVEPARPDAAPYDSGPHLASEVTLRNVGGVPVVLDYGAPGHAELRAFRTHGGRAVGPPVWYSERRAPWEQPYPLVYAGTGRREVVRPGGATRFGLRVPLIEVLGDSLPDGVYAFAVRVTLDAPRTARDVPAGTLRLRLVRPPLPARRLTDVFAFEAAVHAGADSLRARATVTLVNGTSALVRLPAACELEIHAYRSRARRDAAPRAGPGDVVVPACAPAAPAARASIYRGQPQVVERAAAWPTTGQSSGPPPPVRYPPVRYYFAAVLRAPARVVWMAAGEGDGPALR